MTDDLDFYLLGSIGDQLYYGELTVKNDFAKLLKDVYSNYLSDSLFDTSYYEKGGISIFHPAERGSNVLYHAVASEAVEGAHNSVFMKRFYNVKTSNHDVDIMSFPEGNLIREPLRFIFHTTDVINKEDLSVAKYDDGKMRMDVHVEVSQEKTADTLHNSNNQLLRGVCGVFQSEKPDVSDTQTVTTVALTIVYTGLPKIDIDIGPLKMATSEKGYNNNVCFLDRRFYMMLEHCLKPCKVLYGNSKIRDEFLKPIRNSACHEPAKFFNQISGAYHSQLAAAFNGRQFLRNSMFRTAVLAPMNEKTLNLISCAYDKIDPNFIDTISGKVSDFV